MEERTERDVVATTTEKVAYVMILGCLVAAIYFLLMGNSKGMFISLGGTSVAVSYLKFFV